MIADLKQQRLDAIAAAATTDGEPVAPGFTRLTFAEIDRHYAALTALSQRRLDDARKSDRRVRRLIVRHYAEAYQVFKDFHHLIIKNNPVPAAWEDDERIPIVIAERRQSQLEDLKRDTWDIPTVPDGARLTPDDMPITGIKGELGHQNRTGVADIKRNLGALYVEDDDDDTEGDD